mgnify:CR=1 FL=1
MDLQGAERTFEEERKMKIKQIEIRNYRNGNTDVREVTEEQHQELLVNIARSGELVVVKVLKEREL